MSNVASLIHTQLEACLAVEAGIEYKELKYLDDLTANSFTGGNDKRFGVRPLGATINDDAEVNKSLTYSQTFQFVLTKGCYLSGVSDRGKYDAYLELHEIALRFNSKVKGTKAGVPTRVLNTLSFEIDPPEFLDDKVAVLTGNIEIIYRLTL